MSTLKEKLDEMARIKSELQRMETDDSVTEEDSGDLRDTLVERWEQLDQESKPIIARMERIRGITRSADSPENTENGDGSAAARWDGGGRGPEFMQRRDPFEDLDKVRDRMLKPAEIVSRAVTAVEGASRQGLLEQDKAQESTLKAQRNPYIARHMLLTGSGDYVEAFRAYIEDPVGEAQRAALSLTAANGGYLLPYVLDPTIVLTNSASANPFRRISKVVTTSSNAWQGVNSAGVNAQWLSEAVTAADATPTVGQIGIYPKKAAAWVFGSFEVLDDTNFGAQLPELLADAKDRLEESGFATGTGATGTNAGEPRGVVYAISQTGTGSRVLSTLGTATGALIGTAAAADVYNLQAALPVRFRQSRSVGWVANIRNINKIRALDQYGGSSFWANLGPDTPEQLLGKPIYESSSITNSTAGSTASGSAPLVFGAWDNFVIVDKVGTSMLYEPMIRDVTSNTPTGQAGWFYFWRSGSDVTTPSAFRWLSNGSG